MHYNVYSCAEKVMHFEVIQFSFEQLLASPADPALVLEDVRIRIETVLSLLL